MKNFIASWVFKIGCNIMAAGIYLHKKFKTPAGLELLQIENFQKAFLNAISSEVQAKKNRNNFFVVKGSEESN